MTRAGCLPIAFLGLSLTYLAVAVNLSVTSIALPFITGYQATMVLSSMIMAALTIVVAFSSQRVEDASNCGQ